MSPLVNATDLRDMRAAQAAAMPDVCTVSRLALTSDGQGGWTEVWSTASTTVCRVAAGGLSPQEQAQADKMTSKQVWTVSLPYATDVTVKDRVLVSGRIFEVMGVLAPHTWEAAKRCVCEENL